MVQCKVCNQLQLCTHDDVHYILHSIVTMLLHVHMSLCIKCSELLENIRTAGSKLVAAQPSGE